MITELINANEKYLKELDDSPLIALAESGHFSTPASRKILLSYLKNWSNEYQKMVLARVVFSQQDEYLELAHHHLQEEYGHNLQLSSDRSWKQITWDPVLEALGHWFTMKMLTLGDLERTVLVHLVREKAAAKFYKHFQPVFSDEDPQGHFQLHLESDCNHAKMGIDLLTKTFAERKGSVSIEPLLDIQQKGWAMIKAFHKHLAHLCVANCTI